MYTIQSKIFGETSVESLMRRTIAILLISFLATFLGPTTTSANKYRRISDVMKKEGKAGEARIRKHFESQGLHYPPRQVAFVAIKDERRVEIWTREKRRYRFVHSYVIRGISGKKGPKNREGDLQAPEGIYNVPRLNPNSDYHLSMKINYPNASDKRRARKERRKNLGGDIYIHGKAVSAGCLAMGDKAIEELFALAVRIKKENIRVVIAPSDARRHPLVAEDGNPNVQELYDELENEMQKYQ